jgi:hypothetical protein
MKLRQSLVCAADASEAKLLMRLRELCPEGTLRYPFTLGKPYYYDVNPKMGKESLLSFCLEKDRAGFILCNMEVYEDKDKPLRRKGLGKLALRFILGVVYENGKNRLDLMRAINDGSRFWLSMGAEFKSSVKPNVRSALGGFLTKTGGKLDDKSRELVCLCHDLARTDELVAVRKLSRGIVRLRDTTDCTSDLFRQICNGCDLVFKLDEPETLKILKAKLGDIPPFKEKTRPLVLRRRQQNPSLIY